MDIYLMKIIMFKSVLDIWTKPSHDVESSVPCFVDSASQSSSNISAATTTATTDPPTSELTQAVPGSHPSRDDSDSVLVVPGDGRQTTADNTSILSADDLAVPPPTESAAAAVTSSPGAEDERQREAASLNVSLTTTAPTTTTTTTMTSYTGSRKIDRPVARIAPAVTSSIDTRQPASNDSRACDERSVQGGQKTV